MVKSKEFESKPIKTTTPYVNWKLKYDNLQAKYQAIESMNRDLQQDLLVLKDKLDRMKGNLEKYLKQMVHKVTLPNTEYEEALSIVGREQFIKIHLENCSLEKKGKICYWRDKK